MRRFVLSTALMGLILQGCSVARYSSIDATDFSAVEIGQSQKEIETALGAPTKITQKNGLQLATYEFNRGREADYDKMASGLAKEALAAAAYGPFMLVVLGQYNEATAEVVRAQRRSLPVYYNEERLAVSIGPYALNDHTTQQQGDATEQRALCGQTNAQYGLGYWYETGKFGFPANSVESFKWYRIASIAGHGPLKAGQARVAQQMSPDLVVEAERKAAVWQPTLEICPAAPVFTGFAVAKKERSAYSAKTTNFRRVPGDPGSLQRY